MPRYTRDQLYTMLQRAGVHVEPYNMYDYLYELAVSHGLISSSSYQQRYTMSQLLAVLRSAGIEPVPDHDIQYLHDLAVEHGLIPAESSYLGLMDLLQDKRIQEFATRYKLLPPSLQSSYQRRYTINQLSNMLQSIGVMVEPDHDYDYLHELAVENGLIPAGAHSSYGDFWPFDQEKRWREGHGLGYQYDPGMHTRRQQTLREHPDITYPRR